MKSPSVYNTLRPEPSFPLSSMPSPHRLISFSPALPGKAALRHYSGRLQLHASVVLRLQGGVESAAKLLVQGSECLLAQEWKKTSGHHTLEIQRLQAA